MKLVRNYTKVVNSFTPLSYFILEKSILLSCTFLLCTALSLLAMGDLSIDTYYLYKYAEALFELPTALLIPVVIVIMCIEDLSRK